MAKSKTTREKVGMGNSIHIHPKWIRLDEPFSAENILDLGWEPTHISVRGRIFIGDRDDYYYKDFPIKHGRLPRNYTHPRDCNIVLGCSPTGEVNERGISSPYFLRNPEEYNKVRDWFLSKLPTSRIQVRHLRLSYEKPKKTGLSYLSVIIVPVSYKKGDSWGGILKVNGREIHNLDAGLIEKIAPLLGKEATVVPCQLLDEKRQRFKSCDGLVFRVL